MYIRWQREDYSTPLLRDGLSHVHRTAAGRIADIISVTWRRIHVTAPVPHLVVDIQYMTLPQLMLVIFKQTWHAKMRMPKKFGKIFFSSSVARRPTINFFLWHFNKLLLEAELFTEFEFASFSGWRSTKRSRKFWGAALDQTHAHLLSSGMLLASQAIPQSKFTSFDSCRNNQEKVPNLGVFVHSYYSNSWDFRHPSKAK